MSLVLDEHRQYLSDRHRLDAYARAIAEVVRPGAVVVDLGAGTGVLGLLACRAGAARVYCIEQTALIGLTQAFYRDNGFADRAVFVMEHSLQAELPEKADVVVCDQIGQFGFEAGVLEYFADARRRFLRADAAMVPARIDLYVAPVQHAVQWRQVDFWRRRRAGFDFSGARSTAANTGYPVAFDARNLLGAAARIASVASDAGADPITGAEVNLAIETPGTLHGIGGWFRAQLSPGVSMSNGPDEPKRIGRRNVFFPIERPVEVEPGDRVRVRMTIDPLQTMVTWGVRIEQARAANGAPGPRFQHSTFKGMLISGDDLRRTQPGFVPELTPRGEARRTILELCDGRRALGEIEDEVYRRHPSLFRSRRDAAVFVAEVVTRYAR